MLLYDSYNKALANNPRRSILCREQGLEALDSNVKGGAMYRWQKLDENERVELLLKRETYAYPKHSPPHFTSSEGNCYHFYAANYQHKRIIGYSDARLQNFTQELLSVCRLKAEELYAWCVLPNHWHLLLKIIELKGFLAEIGRLHGRTSFYWNGEENCRGRKCWFACADRRIRTIRHFFATRNYILRNPVKHGYVDSWEQWEYSSVHEYLAAVSEEKAIENLLKYPAYNMGKNWDEE
jgi:putative transposase